MVDSKNEESMKIHSSADSINDENDRPELSMSTTTSSAFCQSFGGFDVNNIAEMEDTVPSIIDARDVDGYTALHRAAYSGHIDTVGYLLSIGANPEWNTNDGWTVLHCAATWSMCEVVAMLLRHGVDVNCRSHGNLTPLHLAITSNQPEDRVLTTVRYLLEAPGIDAAAVSNSGDSPLRVAGRTSAKITEMLTRYFSKP
ncbi:ankyrin repeat domain-containing protein 28 [Loa loa]|uniref:Ankyrin repeat domain-containing protein 28 n=1 Tax=Loa loa TaxID=7209 RepID=A0A1S0UFW9_LOALO|nr:ankyrin repeat domain-containing protein 28 [Loa loa]EJD74590.1 ankyrin repeat domain-containing protein 28 [Loa loa]